MLTLYGWPPPIDSRPASPPRWPAHLYPHRDSKTTPPEPPTTALNSFWSAPTHHAVPPATAEINTHDCRYVSRSQSPHHATGGFDPRSSAVRGVCSWGASKDRKSTRLNSSHVA